MEKIPLRKTQGVCGYSYLLHNIGYYTFLVMSLVSTELIYLILL